MIGKKHVKQILSKYFQNHTKRLKDRNLWQKLLITYLTVALVPIILIGSVSYLKSSRTILQQTQDYASLVINQMSKDLDAYLEKFERITYSAYSNIEVQKVMRNNHDSSFKDRLENRDFMKNFILGINLIDNNIDGVYIYSKYGDVFYQNMLDNISPNYQFNKSKWYEMISKGVVSTLVVSPHREEKYPNTNVMNFSYIRALNDINKGEFLGFILVDIRLKVFESMVGTGESVKGKVLILDEDEKIIYNSPNSFEIKELGNVEAGEIIHLEANLEKIKKKNVVITSKSKRTGWTIVFVTPVAEISSKVREIGDFTIYVALLCTLLIIVMSSLISTGIGRPVKRLEKIIKEVENGNLEAVVEIESNDEIGRLSKSFNRMVSNVRHLIKEIYETQLKKKEAELNALQSQINPHFMYNTLESVNMMAILDGNFDISDTLTAFSKILRFNLDNKSNMVTVEKEIEYVQNYFMLQKIRYKNKFDLIFNVDEDVYGYKIQKLTLQPLVENAITHGFEFVEENGLITLSILKCEEGLWIEVKDNGRGMAPQRLEDVKKSLQLEEALSKEGSIGLNNINERIKLCYGEHCGLSIESVEGKGTRVWMQLPKWYDKREESKCISS